MKKLNLKVSIEVVEGAIKTNEIVLFKDTIPNHPMESKDIETHVMGMLMRLIFGRVHGDIIHNNPLTEVGGGESEEKANVDGNEV